jgi:hypothetical protein
MIFEFRIYIYVTVVVELDLCVVCKLSFSVYSIVSTTSLILKKPMCTHMHAIL